jgi:hypothetical protein
MLELFGNSIFFVISVIGTLFLLSLILWLLRKILHWIVIPTGIVLGGLYLLAVLIIILISKFKIWL